MTDLHSRYSERTLEVSPMLARTKEALSREKSS
jgi:hypothetical protein